ncbi:MAG: hypothetical protein ACQKBT_07125 [Puniceicoccales bacterium]
MSAEIENPASKLKLLNGLRWLAWPIAIVLIGGSIQSLIVPPYPPDWFFRMRAGLEIVLALLLILPFRKIGQQSPQLWKRLFFLLLILAVAFVFARVIGVLFEARAVEAEGGELGLPAWSGTLIFLVMGQLPLILFQRFPDQLD